MQEENRMLYYVNKIMAVLGIEKYHYNIFFK